MRVRDPEMKDVVLDPTTVNSRRNSRRSLCPFNRRSTERFRAEICGEIRAET
jgi:hypothetical protein